MKKFEHSPQWDTRTKKFRNQKETSHPSVFSVAFWRLTHRLRPLGWTAKQTLTSIPPKKSQALRITMIGHATVLVQVNNLAIITDPVYSQACGPFGLFGPRRIHQPGVAFENLPDLDYVVISHNHYDHLDIPTLRRIQKKHSATFIVPLGIKEFLISRGITAPIVELDWWQTHQADNNTNIISVPAHHWSRRSIFDYNKTLWMGAVIQTPDEIVYFAGDTAWGDHFAQIKEKIGAPTLSLLPVGAYAPRQLMSSSHVDPQQAVEAHKQLGSKLSIPIHFDVFPLAGEAYGEAITELNNALKAEKIPLKAFKVLYPSHQYQVPQETTASIPTAHDASNKSTVQESPK